MSITLARTRSVYDLHEVQLALDRSRGRSPELDTFYERMLETGPDRFLTTPSSLDALDPLFEECPNFDEVLADLARYLRLAHAGDKGFNVMPILLLGGPGVGKTHFAKRLAKVMQTDCELISMNALSAGFVITGSSASWRGAKCGKVAERLVRGKYANPVIVLDEVEKASARRSPIRSRPCINCWSRKRPAPSATSSSMSRSMPRRSSGCSRSIRPRASRIPC
jgi:ATP-dependent Lon protease